MYVRWPFPDEKGPEGLEHVGVDEWSMVELQGAVGVHFGSGIGKTPDNKTDVENARDLQGLPLGELALRRAGTGTDGKDHVIPTLTIGHSQLEGKVVKLKRPVVMMKPDHRPGTAPTRQHTRAATGLRVLGVIRRKIVFKARPKPLVPSLPSSMSSEAFAGRIAARKANTAQFMANIKADTSTAKAAAAIASSVAEAAAVGGTSSTTVGN